MATNDMNNVNVIGRLTKDAELSYTSNGVAIGKMSIAVNRARKSGDEWINDVSFFEVKIFGRTAENLKQYLTKGKQVAVSGFLKQERWEKDGEKFSKVTIGAEEVQLIGGNQSNGNSATDTSYGKQEADGSYGFYN